MIAIDTKRCPKCGDTLPLSMFNKNKGRYDGLNGYCRICQVKCNKEYTQTDKGRITRDKQNKSEAHRKASNKYMTKYSPNYRKTHKKETIARKKLLWLFTKYIDRNNFICAMCGKQPIETHHENYNLWYSFIPLCRKCHLSIGVNYVKK